MNKILPFLKWAFGLFVLANVHSFSFGQSASWETIPLPTQAHLREVEYIKNFGWMVVGDSGTVFVNPGSGWQQVPVAGTPNFFSVEFLNYTLNSGKVFLLSSENEPFCFHTDSLTINADTLPGWPEIPGKACQLVNLNITSTVEFRYGVPCDSGNLFAYKTEWNPPTFHFQFATQKEVTDLYPFNAWNILAIGDSGKIWRTVGLDNPFFRVSQNWSQQRLNRIFGKGNNLIWIAGNQGLVLFSSNGGTIWQPESMPVEENFHSGSAVDSTVWICGENGTVISSYDIGETWNLENTGISNDLLCIKAWGNDVYACGKNGKLIKLNRLTSNRLAGSRLVKNIFPGFYEDHIRFSAPFDGNIEILGVEGKGLAHCLFSKGEQVQVQGLPGGIYFFRYQQQDGKSGVERVIILK